MKWIDAIIEVAKFEMRKEYRKKELMEIDSFLRSKINSFFAFEFQSHSLLSYKFLNIQL